MSHTTFNIEVRFLGGLTATQQQVFRLAAARWSQIITGDLPRVSVDGEVIDDVLIEASGTHIDGPRGTLGQAGPTHLRPGTSLPAKGIMEFDRADLARMQADGSLATVIIHEMGHVLGIGTIWSGLGLLQGAEPANPVFTGRNVMREFATLLGAQTPIRGEEIPKPVCAARPPSRPRRRPRRAGSCGVPSAPPGALEGWERAPRPRSRALADAIRRHRTWGHPEAVRQPRGAGGLAHGPVLDPVGAHAVAEKTAPAAPGA